MAALAACARPQAIVLQPQQGPPPGVDGRYRGTARLVRAAGATCPRSGARVLEIQGGSITLSYQAGPRSRQPLTAEIGSDGRIEASDGVGVIQGTLTDGRLEVSVGSALCENRWTLTRVN
jgi:hypothetical protein